MCSVFCALCTTRYESWMCMGNAYYGLKGLLEYWSFVYVQCAMHYYNHVVYPFTMPIHSLVQCSNVQCFSTVVPIKFSLVHNWKRGYFFLFFLSIQFSCRIFIHFFVVFFLAFSLFSVSYRWRSPCNHFHIFSYFVCRLYSNVMSLSFYILWSRAFHSSK